MHFIVKHVAAAAVAFVFLSHFATPVRAGEAPGFEAARAEAYVHYREAAFYVRSGNVAVAGLALDEFIDKWSALTDRFAASPPAEYAGDAEWKATLLKVLVLAAIGLEALDADDVEAAKEAVYPIRGILGDLRRRNGLVGWSDLVDELSAAMDVLARYRKEVKNLGDAATVAMVREQASIVGALFEKCRSKAVSEIAGDPEFKRLVDGASESMGKLLESLETGEIRLYRIGIGELRSYERILYLRFG